MNQMSTMAENVIAAGSKKRPPMLGIIEVPGTATTLPTTRERTFDDLTPTEKIRKTCGIKVTNIILSGLPPDVYSLVNHHTDAKELWDRVKLLMEGETIHSYYLRLAKLINDMNTIGMTMRPLKVNTKFVNHLQSEWSKFVTDIKLSKVIHNLNFDQLYAYPSHQSQYNQQFSTIPQQQQSITPLQQQQFYSHPLDQQSYQAPVVHQHAYEAPVFIINHLQYFYNLIQVMLYQSFFQLLIPLKVSTKLWHS
ncbi:hypothetical protein Tco_1006137 [Tanacetum coccineum]|uniref:Integrase, catalytic region, zinc finger, CCHC-type, peptidase aspartic, catalytic n=1 Tax=Tanacetum coccineum TaxID=301880 RepID=A0ABQ5FHS4_9ASTR